MRKLALASFSFASAILLTYYVVGHDYALPAAGLCAVGCLGALLWYGERRTRYLLIVLGLTAGFLWSWGYNELFAARSAPLVGETLKTEMTALDYSETTDYGARVDARLKLNGRCDVKLFIFDASPDIAPGDIIEAEVTFEDPDDVFEGGGDIYAQRGISLFGQVDGEVMVTSSGFKLRYLPSYAARVLKMRVKMIFPERVRAFMLALLTGDRTELNRDEMLVGALSRAGISHVVAVSGMHLAFLCEFIAIIVRKKRLASAITVPAVVFFMAMTGFSPSVTRAGIMQIFLYAAPLFKREADSLTSLGAALLLILLINPNAAGSAGLQMSFAATLGLILLSGRLYDAIYRHVFKRKKKRKKVVSVLIHLLLTTVSSTVGALIFTVPLSAAHFGTVSLAAPVVNLLTSGAVSIAFIGGYIVCLVGFIFAPLGMVLARVFSVVPLYIIGTARVFSGIPAFCASVSDPYMLIWIIYLYLMLLAFILLRLKFRQLLTATALLLITLAAVSVATSVRPTVNSAGLTFTVLDVGQGLCCVAESEGCAVVIDCGSSSGEQPGKTALQFLRGRGYSRANLMILTHYHADHCNGAGEFLAGMKTDALMGPVGSDADETRVERISSLAEDAGTDIIFVDSDMTVTLGAMTLSVFAPVDDIGENERGVCVLVTCGEYDVLITGDAGSETEHRLMDHADLPDIETLVVGHHGSRYSTGKELLYRLSPETAIISVGENSYGHPTEATLSRLSDFGAEIFRTDEIGNITVCSQ